MIKSVIIEDELLSRMYLSSLLKTWCSTVEVVATAVNCDDAIAAIQQWQPDLIFLDIELLNSNGFDVVKRLYTHYPKIIFTTALGDHTIKIIKPSGLLFLQKPIDSDDLIAVIDKASSLNDELHLQQIQQLLITLANENKPAALYAEITDSNTVFIMLSEIIFIEAKGAHTIFFTADGRALTACNLSLRDCESILKGHAFYRVSQQHIVNINFAELLTESDVTFLMMKNQSKIIISPKCLEAVKAAL